MRVPALSRVCVAVSALSLLLPLAGCKLIADRVAKQADADPTLRAHIIESARNSCIQTSRAKFPEIPNRDALIVNYCGCVSDKGLATFSNGDFARIGLSPDHALTPEQNKKLDAAVEMCMNEATKQSAPPTQ